MFGSRSWIDPESINPILKTYPHMATKTMIAGKCRYECQLGKYSCKAPDITFMQTILPISTQMLYCSRNSNNSHCHHCKHRQKYKSSLALMPDHITELRSLYDLDNIAQLFAPSERLVFDLQGRGTSIMVSKWYCDSPPVANLTQKKSFSADFSILT